MTRARPVFQCPLCGELAPLSGLVADERGVEMTCAQCENAVRFKPFSDVDADASVDAKTKNMARSITSSRAEESSVQRPNKNLENGAENVPETSLKTAQLVELIKEIPELDKELAEDYRQVVTTGDELKAHKNLVKRAAVLNQLKEFGRLYKLRLEQDSDDRVAKACQEQIIALAIAQLKPQKIEMTGSADKSKQAIIITLSLLVTVAAIAWMLHQGLL